MNTSIYLISEDVKKYVKGDLVECEEASCLEKADFTDNGRFLRIVRLLRTP